MTHPSDEGATGVLRRYHVSGEVSTVASQLPPELPSLVGRDTMLELLWQRFLSGSRLVFLTGPSGIGKTTLTAAICHRMVRAGYFGDGVIWVDGRQARSHAGVVQELAFQIGLPEVVADGTPQRERYLAQQVVDHNYLFVLDNLDALEGGRLHTLRFLRQLSGATLVTARLHPPGVDVPERVEPLSPTDTHRLLEQLLGKEVPPTRLEALLDQVDGSPLATRLVAACLAEGHDPVELTKRLIRVPTRPLRVGHFHGQSPSTLRAFLVAWQEFSPAQRELLFAASCLQRPFSLPLLAQLLPRGEETALAATVEVLQRWGVIERVGQGWYLHHVALEAVRTLGGARRAWHQRAAGVRRQGSGADQLAAAEHLRHAGDVAGSARLLVQQGPVLMRAGLHEPLASLLALFVADEVSREQWLQLCELQGDLAVRMGRLREARHFYDCALDPLSKGTFDESKRGTALRLARKQGEVGLAEASAGGGPAATQRATLWLERAHQLVKPEDAEEGARLLLLQSQLAGQHGALHEALRAAERALQLATRQQVSPLLAPCYRRIGDLYRALHQVPTAAAAYESALAWATADEPRERAALLRALAEIQQDQGYWLEAVETLGASLRLLRQSSLDEALVSTLLRRSALLVRQGRYREAQPSLQEAQTVARRLALRDLSVLASALQAEVLLLQGEHDLADALLQRALAEARQHLLIQPLARLHTLRAEAAYQRGASDEVRAQLAEAAIWARRSNDPVECTCVEAYEALFGADPARIETTSERMARQCLWYEQARLQGRLAALLVSWDSQRARATLIRAMELFARLGARPQIEQLAPLRSVLGV